MRSSYPVQGGFFAIIMDGYPFSKVCYNGSRRALARLGLPGVPSSFQARHFSEVALNVLQEISPLILNSICRESGFAITSHFARSPAQVPLVSSKLKNIKIRERKKN